MMLELASQAYKLYVSRTPTQKRELLNLLLSNCSWKGGEQIVTYREPFDILAKMTAEQEKEKAAGDESSGLSPIQRGGRDTF